MRQKVTEGPRNTERARDAGKWGTESRGPRRRRDGLRAGEARRWGCAAGPGKGVGEAGAGHTSRMGQKQKDGETGTWRGQRCRPEGDKHGRTGTGGPRRAGRTWGPRETGRRKGLPGRGPPWATEGRTEHGRHGFAMGRPTGRPPLRPRQVLTLQVLLHHQAGVALPGPPGQFDQGVLVARQQLLLRGLPEAPGRLPGWGSGSRGPGVQGCGGRGAGWGAAEAAAPRQRGSHPLRPRGRPASPRFSRFSTTAASSCRWSLRSRKRCSWSRCAICRRRSCTSVRCWAASCSALSRSRPVLLFASSLGEGEGSPGQGDWRAGDSLEPRDGRGQPEVGDCVEQGSQDPGKGQNLADVILTSQKAESFLGS